MHDFFMWAGNIIIFSLFSVIAWVLKMVFSAIKEVEDNQKLLTKGLAEHKLHAAETFATKIDVQSGFERIMNKLDKIDDKLDGKEDKK